MTQNKADLKMLAKLNEYLLRLVKGDGSDLHIKSDSVVYARINGDIIPFSDEILSKDDCVELAKEILDDKFNEFITKKNLDFSYHLNDEFRFRVNVFFQMSGISFVFRTIPARILTFDELKLPASIEKICNTIQRGLVLITGPTGSGKTTTIASMINHINKTQKRHIVTIEDPIEYIYKGEKSLINQRAIGHDARSFNDALRASLREDPDIIFIGEIRDTETIEIAMHAAETGHLVFSTLHTIDAKETIGRVVGLFPKEEQHRIRITFSSVLAAIISQRLVQTIDDSRRVAVEVMIKNLRIRNMLLDENTDDIYTAITEGKNTYGMQTFDQHLLELYDENIISAAEALEKATKPNDLEIKIRNVNLARRRALLKESEDEIDLENEGIVSLKIFEDEEEENNKNKNKKKGGGGK